MNKKSPLVYKNDLGLIGVRTTSSKLETIPFLKEPLVLVVSPNHPLAKKEIVSLIELGGYPSSLNFFY